MNRRVLLLEPNYRNKYPPMGLMKLAMYHRLQGDDVVFFKGNLSDFVLSQIVDETIKGLSSADGDIEWRMFRPEISTFVKTGKIEVESPFEQVSLRPYVMRWLQSSRRGYRTGGYYSEPRWDRVCVTTLFTFYWDITIDTIEFAKKVCKNADQVMVGGVLASVIPDKVKAVTGITPHVGCLDICAFPGDDTLPEPFQKTCIDALPLDYSILEEIDYRYPVEDAYYAHTTRGCVNKCAFCAVPRIEPEYRSHMSWREQLSKTIERFGQRRHLLLMDNNVFASSKFNAIIDEIAGLGFKKGAKFTPPDQLITAVGLLESGWNDRAYIRMVPPLLKAFVEKLEGDEHDRSFALLLNNGVLTEHTVTKEKLLLVCSELKELYQNRQPKRAIVRFVDFNQGMDARLANSRNMAKLATVAIRPLRIAFDNWGMRKDYVRAVCLAQKNGITQMSNYLLYNFQDKPTDLYNRLLLNIDLCEALGVHIYSFPMKYHPIMDEKWFSNRDYIGRHWTRKAIRTVQSILNSTKGKVGRGRTFFYKAFGRDHVEFEKLLRMPEAFIIHRWDAEISGLTAEWAVDYDKLNEKDRSFVDGIVDTNNFNSTDLRGQSKKVCKVLNYYLIKADGIPQADCEKKKKTVEAFENSCPAGISSECQRLLNAVSVT